MVKTGSTRKKRDCERNGSEFEVGLCVCERDR